jgi:DNA-binding CsgD family transcriptional regulator
MDAIVGVSEEQRSGVHNLGRKLLGCAIEISELETPEDVLDHLDDVTYPALDLRVLSAIRFPLKATDWSALALGRNVFLHSQAPRGAWEEWSAKIHENLPIGYMMARSAIAPHTWQEALQALQPIGADRWGYDLALKYGMRDALVCPVGGRWLITFWSKKSLARTVSLGARVMIFAAASFAGMRLEQIVGADPARVGTMVRLTPRELAVLRLLSFGAPLKKIAEVLGLSEETIRTHCKNAQVKLGAGNRTHAVAEAIRQHLVI